MNSYRTYTKYLRCDRGVVGGGYSVHASEAKKEVCMFLSTDYSYARR